jgi:polyisoprenyl-phosphate glycosyltransferase
MNQQRKRISVVTPCFNEREAAPDCYRTVRQIFETHLPDYDYEHVFCDNASTDGTDVILAALAAQDPRVKVILNARNFGPGPSTINGILSTTGDAVFVFLPADMQDPPDLMPEFVRKWEEGNKIVYGVRKKREEGFLLKYIRKMYYRAVSRIAEIDLKPDVGDFQLVDRVVIEALRRFDDHNPYLRGMLVHCGFQSTGVEYTWKERKKGFSKSTIFHLVDVALNGMLAFTKAPMRFCLFAGFGIASLSILVAILNLIGGLINYQQIAAPGIMTLIVALFFFSGVQLFFLGILGEYILAIHSQVRRKPAVVERGRLNFEERPILATSERFCA